MAMKVILLDSTPLGLFLQKRDYQLAEECRNSVQHRRAAGDRILVPAIVAYEVRRELLRLGKTVAIRKLDSFIASVPDRLLALTSADLHRAASLWADVRRRGMPTADIHALDVDVILAAQALNLGLPTSEFVVAIGNIAHLSRFVPAEEWSRI
jgi:hypothetical protein